MKIAIDIDDCLAEQVEALLDSYNLLFKDKLTMDKLATWDWAQYATMASPQAFYDLMRPELYSKMRMVPGALEGVKALRAAGHEIVFVTAGPLELGPAKLAWLKWMSFLPENGGVYKDGRVYKEFFLAYDKDAIRADLIIDDRVETVRTFPKYGILFYRPWNESAKVQDWPTDKFRANNWTQVVAIVRRIDNHNQKTGSSGILSSLGAATDAPGAKLEFKVPPDNTIWDNSAGVKNDDGKLLWNLLPWSAAAEVVKVLMFGAKKYSLFNWAEGMPWTRNQAAAIRHLIAWEAGENNDPESHLSHIAHAICCLLFLQSYITAGMKDKDDRPKGFPAFQVPENKYEVPAK